MKTRKITIAVARAKNLQEAKEKNPILLSQYLINEEFDSGLKLFYNPISPFKVMYKNLTNLMQG